MRLVLENMRDGVKQTVEGRMMVLEKEVRELLKEVRGQGVEKVAGNGKKIWHKEVEMREEEKMEEEFEKEAEAFFYKAKSKGGGGSVDFSKPGGSRSLVFKF